AVAVLYLAARAVMVRHRLEDSRIRILVVTVAAVLFFAVISRKTIYYVVHIETWLALCGGILLVDAARAVGPWRSNKTRLVRAAYGLAGLGLARALLVLFFPVCTP